MAASAVTSTVLWLGNLLTAEINYFGEVRDEVETLRSNLRMLAAFEVEADKSRRQDDLVRNALVEIRDLAHDCEDVIETYMLQVARHGYEQYEGCHLGSVLRWACLLREGVSLYKIHSEIDALNKRIDTLRSNLLSFGVAPRINNTDDQQQISTPLRPVFPHEREEHVVVGLESQLEELVGRLKDSANQKVMLLCGMGGVGKSTLAMELYHHPALKEDGYFQAFAWATASQRLQTNQVLQTLLYSLVPENDIERRRKIDEDIKANQLHMALYRMMQQVKCLVVIDDIWTSRDWRQLEAAFPRKAKTGSRLILTSRKDNILSDLEPDQVHLHLVHSLDDANSWQLFEKITFGDATCTDSEKQKLGLEMLQHCKGVPLAICVLAKLLRAKKSLKEWQQISNDISAQIRRGDATPYKQVYDVLQVSYDELPFHLKQCFLHFASYPEDFRPEVGTIYAIWISQGLILKDDTNELEEDIAERCLKELASRNMVQLQYWDDNSAVVNRCSIHDLMRDVCIEIARRERFLQQVKCHPSMLYGKSVRHLFMTSLPQIDKRLRRLNVHVSQHQEAQTSTLHDIATSKLPSADISRAPNLRTLSINHAGGEEGDEEDCTRLIEIISQDFPLLRVLKCLYLPIKGQLPEKIGDLIHLRYLGLWLTRISEVPSSIEKLQFLQTLALDSVEGVVVFLPNILWKLKQLRHLYLPFVELHEIPTRDKPRYLVKGGGELWLDGLCNLQTAQGIDLDRVSVEGLSQLDRLKTVEATCETKREALSPFLNNTSLKELQLRLGCQVINEEPMILSTCEALQNFVLHGREGSPVNLNKPLSLEMLPKSLISLRLYYLKLDADPLPVLEQLPNLESLGLEYCDGLSMMACSAGGFPQLTELDFTGLPEFYSWEVEEGALPKLKKLWIYYCPLKKVPDAIPSSVTVFIE